MQGKLLLKGLECPNCASKIESKISEIEEIDNVLLNFSSSKLTYKSESNVVDKIIDTVNKIEDGITIIELDDEDKESRILSIDGNIVYKSITINNKNNWKKLFLTKNSIYRIFIGSIFFVSAILGKELANINLFSYLYIVSYFIIGFPVLKKGLKNVFQREIFDENFLMMIATIGALIIGEWPEAVGVMFFYGIGEILEHRAINKSKKSIESLLDIKATYANLIKNGKILRVDPSIIKIGDKLLVNVGERVAVDGFITKGYSYFDTSAITGESVDRFVNVGDNIVSGFINKGFSVEMQVSSSYKNSTVNKIIEMVQNATEKKSKMESYVTKLARYYTPTIVLLTIIISIFPPIILGEDFIKWLYRGLIFLVVSCPCAIVLSVPLTYFLAIGAASKNSILIKGSIFLDMLKDVGIIIFDKTGTLTNANFVVDKDNLNYESRLYIYLAEKFSSHPIAKAVVKHYEKDFESLDIEKYNIKDIKEVIGKGISLKINEKNIVVGNKIFMDELGIDVENIYTEYSIIYLAINSKASGYLILCDEIKKEIPNTIYNLKKRGINNIFMLTGDKKESAMKVANKLKINRVYSDLLPQDKANIVQKIVADSNKKVIFVGDGINDAVALVNSDIGISMGNLGSDVAIEASDIILMKDEISKINVAIDISKFSKKIVIENIVFALFIKFTILFLVSIGLSNMWLAIFADVGVTLITVLNAFRIINKKFT